MQINSKRLLAFVGNVSVPNRKETELDYKREARGERQLGRKRLERHNHKKPHLLLLEKCFFTPTCRSPPSVR